jgi:ribosomal protein L1
MAVPPAAANGDEEGAAGKVSPGAKVRVKEGMLAKAIRALKQVVAKRTSNANPLFGENTETVTVIFTLSSVPKGRRMKPFCIPLPHPMFDDKSEVCFISKDPQKQYKELLLQTHKVPGLTKVIGMDQLRRKYKDVPAKRALADAFDLFLCDDRVVEMMPKVLGSVFYSKKKKLPIPVRLKPADPRPALLEAIGCTTLRMPLGPSLGVKFGRCSMTEEQLVKNALAVVAASVKFLSKSKAEDGGHRIVVQAVHVQATESLALPVWRRAQTPGELLDLKKYHSDASSAASDTGASGATASETEATEMTRSDLGTSDVGEALSSRASETASDINTDAEHSELDSAAGDVDEAVAEALPKEQMPLLRSVNRGGGKRKRGAGASAPPAAEGKPAKAAPAEAEAKSTPMGPPAKMIKKAQRK